MITINKNGYETTGDKETLKQILKDPKFREMIFSTPVYLAGVYVTTAYIKIKRGDRYCNPLNKDKIYTSVNNEGDKVGLRPAYKAIKESEIREVRIWTRE